MISDSDQTNLLELLAAFQHASAAVKRLREVVTLCEDQELGAACDMPAIDLSDDLAVLERIIGSAIRRQNMSLRAAHSSSRSLYVQ